MNPLVPAGVIAAVGAIVAIGGLIGGRILSSKQSRIHQVEPEEK
jgi:hypothetical protein